MSTLDCLINFSHPTEKTVKSATRVTDLVCQRRQIDVFLPHTPIHTQTHTHRPVTLSRRLFSVSDAGMNHIKMETWQKTQNERLGNMSY